jgi:alpha-amylase/alpha-mannosidase (GH57 family)
MPHPLHIAFVWHQHQPMYKYREGKYRLPWVRLHGTKDYLDLILLLAKYPKLHQTVNLVPSLILQLEDYINGVAFDPYLELALLPTENLTDAHKRFIVHHFFDANHHTLIDPHPRYRELYASRQEKGEEWCWANWGDRDYSDLLAWHNLAWIDPLFWDDPDIADWLRRDRDFTLADRQRIYSKQREILSRIIPQHKLMQEAGQLEVTTTPYTHPILPLLADTNSGRVAIPNMTLPQRRFQWAEDIPRHLRKAKEIYRDRFDRDPVGLWPSEQSVSPAILTDVAAAGFKWLCTDEAILGSTLQHFFHRDGSGNVREPELLYRPYRLETPDGDLAIVFRDRRLSDLIGFTYSGMDANAAAGDLVKHLEAIAAGLVKRQTTGNTSLDEPWLVTIALDGENCWEHYYRDGIPFLTNLYDRFSRDDRFKLVTVNEFCQQYPPTATLPSRKLHSGSWVDGNFCTWIGDPAKNRAWDLLTAARETLARHPEATETANPTAWEAIYAAEGSDWFWWFGEGHSSNQDAIFDRLFRDHLIALYRALNEPIPPELEKDVERHDRRKTNRPMGYIHPEIDGRGDEQDWDFAGRLEVGGARGTMHQSSPVQQIYYGLDHSNFYLRIDFQSGIKFGQDIPGELNLFWYYPGETMHNSHLPLAELPRQINSVLNYRFHHRLYIDLEKISPRYTPKLWFQEAIDYDRWIDRSTLAKAAWNTCLEISIPWQDLNVSPDFNMDLICVFADRGRYRSFLPDEGFIHSIVP